MSSAFSTRCSGGNHEPRRAYPDRLRFVRVWNLWHGSLLEHSMSQTSPVTETPCSCDWVTGECQGPLGCQAVAEVIRLRAEIDLWHHSRPADLAPTPAATNGKCTFPGCGCTEGPPCPHYAHSPGQIQALETSPELLALIERAKNHVMSPQEIYEQRRSFTRGMCPSNRDYKEWCAAVDRLLPPLSDSSTLGNSK